jgi:hypothetical protein
MRWRKITINMIGIRREKNEKRRRRMRGQERQVNEK